MSESDFARTNDELHQAAWMTDPAMIEQLEALREHIATTLGYRMQDRNLLRLSVTHASMCDANAPKAERLAHSNERLEFLGDALLGAAVTDLLLLRYPDDDEGQLSAYKSRLVSRRTLARAMEAHDLDRYCLVGKQLPAPWPDSVKANLAEGLLAAIFRDGGWDALRQAVAHMIEPVFAAAQAKSRVGDAKNRLQQWAQIKHKTLPEYDTQRCGGSDHDPRFRSHVCVADITGIGESSSRRRSEEAAAADALAQLEALRKQWRGRPGDGHPDTTAAAE